MNPKTFPPFDLMRLLTTVFAPKPGERVAILIDLPDPRAVKDFTFFKDRALTIQRHAHDVFYLGLKKGVLAELKLAGGDLFAYQVTGGSNLDLPGHGFRSRGARGQFGEGHISPLRHPSLHLHFFGDRASDGVCQTIRFSRGHLAWLE